ncbi:MAG TPA: hypothetical protein VF593_12180 [Chthoniobacteraceae bacterium]
MADPKRPRRAAKSTRPRLDKRALLRSILTELTAELERYAVTARAAHAEATHEQSKAENKYDTRGLEASYLAQGQSRQAAETELARQQFESLEIRPFNPEEPVELGALVEVEVNAERTRYFIGPRAGGLEITQGGTEVIVITPQSPLGQQLTGRKQGDQWQTGSGRTLRKFRVISVS